MAITVIVELQAKPGGRDELERLLEGMVANEGSSQPEEAAASGAYAPLIELLAAPFRATVLRQLP